MDGDVAWVLRFKQVLLTAYSYTVCAFALVRHACYGSTVANVRVHARARVDVVVLLWVEGFPPQSPGNICKCRTLPRRFFGLCACMVSEFVILVWVGASCGSEITVIATLRVFKLKKETIMKMLIMLSNWRKIQKKVPQDMAMTCVMCWEQALTTCSSYNPTHR